MCNNITDCTISIPGLDVYTILYGNYIHMILYKINV